MPENPLAMEAQRSELSNNPLSHPTPELKELEKNKYFSCKMTKASLPLSQDIGRSMGEIDALWDENADKYKCCCRSLHVTRASLFIAYAQMLVTFVFAIFFSFYYIQAINGHLSADHWINQLGDRYISSMIFAISIQLVLVLLLIYGIRSDRRSFLVPFIIFASIAIMLGFAQLAHDFFGFICGSTQQRTIYQNNQFFSHLIGTLVHMWCVAVVWRCHGFLGDKKVARQIGEQLSATHVAFHYGNIPYGYIGMPQPPPYADTVLSADKQPLTIA